MDPIRRCDRTDQHLGHRYWMNFHGDDAYDESYECPGLEPHELDLENRRDNT